LRPLFSSKVLQPIPGLRIIGTAKEKAGVISFVLDGFRTEEIGDLFLVCASSLLIG
jgi:cysteine desulfurase/selenocysteine lyase